MLTMGALKDVFAHRLKALREKKGLSQDALAKSIGISRASLGHYENGERLPDIYVLSQMADFFPSSADYLIGKEICTTPDMTVIHDVTGFSEEAITYFADMKLHDPERTAVLNHLIEYNLLDPLLAAFLLYIGKEGEIRFRQTDDGFAPVSEYEQQQTNEYTMQKSIGYIVRTLSARLSKEELINEAPTE